MLFRCPICGLETEEENNQYFCKNCLKNVEPEIFEELRVCPDCNKELTVIMGCGVDDYYCEECRKTVMKANIKKEYRKI